MPDPSATMAIVRRARDMLTESLVDPSMVVVSERVARLLEAEHGGHLPVTISDITVLVDRRPDAPGCVLYGLTPGDDAGRVVGYRAAVRAVLFAEPNPYGA